MVEEVKKKEMIDEKEGPGKTISKIMEKYKEKIEAGVLPPDPARVLKRFPLDLYADIEHVLPVPPIVETIHKEVVVPLIEKMPRFPMTAEFTFKDWLKWKKEKI